MRNWVHPEEEWSPASPDEGRRGGGGTQGWQKVTSGQIKEWGTCIARDSSGSIPGILYSPPRIARSEP